MVDIDASGYLQGFRPCSKNKMTESVKCMSAHVVALTLNLASEELHVAK